MYKSADRSTGVVSGPHPEFSKIERSAHFSDKKLCYYSPNVRNYFTFLSYQSEIPKFGYDKSFIDSDIGNPSPTITWFGGEVVSPNSHLKPLLDRADIRCQLDDSFGGGVEMNTNNIFVTRRAPKCLNTFEDIENMGTNIS